MLLRALRPELCSILGYSRATSVLTKMAFSGILSTFPISIKMSPKSLIYDQPFYITRLRWWSKNYDTFSLDVPHLEMTGLPRRSLRRL